LGRAERATYTERPGEEGSVPVLRSCRQPHGPGPRRASDRWRRRQCVAFASGAREVRCECACHSAGGAIGSLGSASIAYGSRLERALSTTRSRDTRQVSSSPARRSVVLCIDRRYQP